MFDECKGCQKRHVGCHSQCESYKADKAKSDAIRDKRNHDNFVRCGVEGSNIRAAEKVRKKKRGSRR